MALPVWWATMGILLVLGYWFWSLATNAIGLARAGQAMAIGVEGESARHAFVATALGGFAQPYAHAGYEVSDRVVVGSMDMSIDVRAFPSPDELAVRARNVARVERFYPRAPDQDWE